MVRDSSVTERLLPLHVVAQRVGVATRTARWYVQTRQISAERVGQRAWGVPESALKGFRRRHRNLEREQADA